MAEKLIESLVCGSCHSSRGKQHFVVIEYQDGTEANFNVPGECRAYLDTGFLVDADGKWLFYNADGLKVAEREQEELGISVEITFIGCYAFNKEPSAKSIRNVNFFYVTHSGETIENPKGYHILGLPAEYEFPSSLPDDDADEDDEMDEEDELLSPRLESWTEVQNCFSAIRK